MKRYLAIFSLFVFSCSNKSDGNDSTIEKSIGLQKIDTANYYNFYSNGDGLKGHLGTGWLESFEVVPILVNTLRDEGFTDCLDYELFKLSTGQYIVLTVYNDDPEFGIIFVGNHEFIPQKKDRYRKSIFQKYGYEFEQVTAFPNSKIERVEIPKLPSNIFILQSDCYWYQYSDNIADSIHLVSKKNAVEILKQDIFKIIAKIDLNKSKPR